MAESLSEAPGAVQRSAPPAHSESLCPRCGAIGNILRRRRDAEGRPMYVCPDCDAVWGPVTRMPARPMLRAWVAFGALLVAALLVATLINPGLWRDVLEPDRDEFADYPHGKDWSRLGDEVAWTSRGLGEIQRQVQAHQAGRVTDEQLAQSYDAKAGEFQQRVGTLSTTGPAPPVAAVQSNLSQALRSYGTFFALMAAFHRSGDPAELEAAGPVGRTANLEWYKAVDACRAEGPCARAAGLEAGVLQVRLRIENRSGFDARAATWSWGEGEEEFENELYWCGSTVQGGAWRIDAPDGSEVDATCTARYPPSGRFFLTTSLEGVPSADASQKQLVEVHLELGGRLGVSLLAVVCPDATLGIRVVDASGVRVVEEYESQPATC